MTKFLDGFGLLFTGLTVAIIIMVANMYIGGENLEKIIYGVLLIALFFEVFRLKKENKKLKEQLNKT